MKTVARILTGSRLYGTNDPDSDYDHITIVIGSPEEIVMGVRRNTQNKAGDDDAKVFDLKSFFEHLKQGQTWALECLFAPAVNVTLSTPLWNLLVRNRRLFVSKDVSAFVGFAMGQARRYSDKGNRLGAIQRVLGWLSKDDIHNTIESMLPYLTDCVYLLSPEMAEHVFFENIGQGRSCDQYFTVCGRQFQLSQQLKVVLPCLEKMEKEFGARARQASAANGKDWKALSHAIRVACEAECLLTTGEIKLPLPVPDAKYIKNVKDGLVPQVEVDSVLEDVLMLVDEAKEKSKLPNSVNHKQLDQLLSSLLVSAVIDEDQFGRNWLYSVRGGVE